MDMLENNGAAMCQSNIPSTNEVDDKQNGMSIADVLRQTANEFLCNKYLQGFEFIQDYKLYYNPITGYFYDQDTALFYHPSTNCYYYYDTETDNYVYYSRPPCKHHWFDKLAERKAFTLLGDSYVNGMSQDEVDVFECLYSLLKDVSKLVDCETFENDILDDEISIHIQEERIDYAPCVRIIEKDSGALNVVTIVGARIGTTSDSDIQLSSQTHSTDELSAVIRYDETKQRYLIMIEKGGSSIFHNGSMLTTYEEVVIDHGDEWQFGEQKIATHIHYGTNTCGTCEPGLLRNTLSTSSVDAHCYHPVRDISKEKLRRINLRNMKKEYGIFDNEHRYQYKYQKKEHNSSNMVMQTSGRQVCANFSAQSSLTVNEAPSPSLKVLDESNRGFNLLQRMGWKQGSGLGRREDGITEPVISEVRTARAGLGSQKEMKLPVSERHFSKQHVLEITRQRFQRSQIVLDEKCDKI
ncbi:unnamed protein product [Thelazia callipaeda]|uniref:G-patch domain-containing protein n=1 Tax=Thelazia callipaeda TaxID=103827 RepID=A0A0N5CMF0_THECL|nr:unnamed protein product [Thelazia callipaeda]